MGIKHGLSKTRLFRIWCAMKCRCYNPHYKQWKNYGGKGVAICDEWKGDFLAFYNWSMKNGYNDTLTIDRINIDGDYSPDNCRWTTYYVQNRNKTCNVWITYRGVTKCLSDWSKQTGINIVTLHRRLQSGWSVDEVIETLPREKRLITYKGVTKCLNAWSKTLCIPLTTLEGRLKSGWTVEKAFESPVKTHRKIIMLTYNGVTKSLIDWSKEKRIPPVTVRYRLLHGWSVEEALETKGREKTL